MKFSYYTENEDINCDPYQLEYFLLCYYSRVGLLYKICTHTVDVNEVCILLWANKSTCNYVFVETDLQICQYERELLSVPWTLNVTTQFVIG